MGLFDVFRGNKLIKRASDSTSRKTSREQPVTTSSAHHKNPKKQEQQPHDYDHFRSGVWLCTRNDAMGKQVGYVAIHKETGKLYAFSVKTLVHSGASDRYCFAKEPEMITDYAQLLSWLDSKSKVYYSDLNKENWKDYFRFMLLPPSHDGETLKKQLLSRDDQAVRDATFAVHDLVLKDPAERKAFLADAHQSLPLIKQNTDTLKMGGLFAPNQRFVSRAVEIIEGNNTEACFCRLLIDEFGPSANGLAQKGFILVQPDAPIGAYAQQGVIECPVCHQQYSIVEEYTGWHIPTIIRCNAINREGKNV